jgi:aminoglycoside/choline kinase family phosphotransferase
MRAWVASHRNDSLETLAPIAGGAGARCYWRARFASGATAIVAHARPEDPEILPPPLRAEVHEIPFVDVTHFLARHGLPVPEIHAVEPDERWLLLEDLGDVRLADLPRDERDRRLHEAIELLARVHGIPPSEDRPFRRHFDEAWVRFELATFERHGPLAGSPELGHALDALAYDIARLPHRLCLRDYQSQNLMIDPAGRLRILDYQDALLAPPELDLAALLHDSYLEIDAALRSALLATYERARGTATDPTALAILVVQRKCKDLGRYVRMGEQTGERQWHVFAGRARASILGAIDNLPRELGALRAELARGLDEVPAP